MRIISVYRIINTVTGKIYVGSTSHTTKRWSVHKKQLTSGTHHCVHLQRSWDKHGRGVFVFEVIEKFTTIDEARIREQSILNSTHPDMLFNTSKKATGGDLISYHPERSRIVTQMRDSLVDRYAAMTTEERRTKYTVTPNPMLGKKHTEESKRRMSIANTGKPGPLGVKRSAEFKARLSAYAKTRIGPLNSFYGRAHSDETKARISRANRGRTPPNAIPVSIDGVIYPNMTAAARALRVVVATIGNRVNSEKFPTYYKIEV